MTEEILDFLDVLHGLTVANGKVTLVLLVVTQHEAVVCLFGKKGFFVRTGCLWRFKVKVVQSFHGFLDREGDGEKELVNTGFVLLGLAMSLYW